MNLTKRKFFFVLITILLLLSAVAFIVFYQATNVSLFNGKRHSTITRTVPVMGTILEVKLEGEEQYLNQIADQIICEIRRIETKFSIFTESEASTINKEASKAPINCSDEMWHILNESKKYYELSGGLFDVSIRPLMQLWGFYRKINEIPSDQEINDCLDKIGFNKIKLDEGKKTVFFEKDGISLDFGGIVKGYAVDCAFKTIPSDKITRGFINLGGNIRTIQPPPATQNTYTIGVRHPINKNDICGTVTISGSKALATSGNYERYVILNGKHYTHIINPLTGRPVENMLSVTVIANDAITADALSTSVFIGGKELARELINKMPELEFLIIQKNSSGEIEIIKIGNSWNQINI